MKGLLIKDFKLMAGQKQFLGVMAFMCVMFVVLYDDPTFMVSYLIIMFSIFTLSTISYDSFDNGNAFLFTLPISRKGYVREKYAYALIIIFASILVIGAVAEIAIIVRHLEYPLEQLVSVLAGSFLAASWMVGVSVPLQLKMGPEKSRIAMLVAMGGIFGIIFAVAKIFGDKDIRLGQIIERAVGDRVWFAILLIVAAGLLILGISYLASVRIMEKKEF